MTADQTALHLTSKEITAIFPELFEIFSEHSEIARELERAPAQGETLAGHIAAVVLQHLQTLADLYVPFVRSQGQSAADLKRLKRTKGYAAFAQQFEQRFAMVPGGFDITGLLAQACRHMHRTKLAMQTFFDKVPPEDKGWVSLHEALEQLSELLDRLDDVRVETEHAKQM
jgi:signal transduction protein with GAF and PtsI domain